MNFNGLSIRSKLVVIILLSGGIGILIAFVGITTSDYYSSRKNLTDQLRTQAHIIGLNSTAAILFIDRNAASESLNSLRANESITEAHIFTRKHKVFASYYRDAPSVLPKKSQFSEGVFYDKGKANIYEPIIIDDEVIGYVFIQDDLSELNKRIWNSARIIFIVLFISLIAIYFIASRLSNIISNPLLQLATRARNISHHKDFSVRVKKTTEDEIGVLIDGFNYMLSQIEKRNAELIKARDVAEKSVKVKEDFLANMSHEIRTPMNAIMGMTDLLVKTPINDEQKRYLKTIKGAGENLLVIINDILDFSKIESGKLKIEKTGFRVHEVIDTVLGTLVFKARKKGLEFTSNIDVNESIVLLGDPVRLNQVLMNLVGNALKFTDKGSVRVECEILNASDKEISLNFSVKDTGIGIPQDKLDDIFQSFTQVDASTTRKHGGTGLGLAICKELVELQGGEIHIESEVGKGSNFHFYIQYEIGTEDDIELTDEDLGIESRNYIEASDVVILLAEDNRFNQVLATSLLDNWNMEYDVAENGREAIDFYKINDYDLILMDIQMPIMGGVEATRIIRTEFPEDKRHIPIIALTANALSGDKDKFLSEGMDDYVSKPYNADELKSKILNAVHKHRSS